MAGSYPQEGWISSRLQIRFYHKQEAKDWAANEEARRQQASYFPEQASQKHTLATTIDRYVELILSSKPKSAKDTLRHLTWWKEKVGGYALARVSPDLIAQHRKELSEGLTAKGTKRSSATVNRYMASLSTVFTYAVKECGWIQTNPMLRVYKLKEARGRDRILSKDECVMLEIQARQRFYASGGNREAYLAFLPFASFPEGFYGYVKKSEFIKAVTNKTKNPAEN